MSDKEKKPIKLFEKLKNVKHIEVYVAIIFIVILLLIYLSNFKTKEKENKITTNEMTVTSYVEDLEQNLKSILSSIAGVSDVNGASLFSVLVCCGSSVTKCQMLAVLFGSFLNTRIALPLIWFDNIKLPTKLAIIREFIQGESHPSPSRDFVPTISEIFPSSNNLPTIATFSLLLSEKLYSL